MRFEVKINTNLQLGLGLKKIIKLGQNRFTKIKQTSKGLVRFGFFTPNLVRSIFITYKIDYITSVHF